MSLSVSGEAVSKSGGVREGGERKGQNGYERRESIRGRV